MPEYLAPGVFVEEVSFRAKSIEGVSTSTTAFVGPTRRGPLSGAPEVITSYADFERLYGGMENLSYASGTDDAPDKVNYVAHAVRAYFDNGGKRLYMARTFIPRTNPGGSVTSDGVARVNLANDGAGNRADLVARVPGSGGNGVVRCFEKASPAMSKSLVSAPLGALVRTGGITAAQPATVDGGIPPFALNNGDQLALDLAGGGNTTITFNGTPAEATGDAVPDPANVTIDPDTTLVVQINGVAQSIPLTDGPRTLAAVAAEVNGRLRFGYARVEGDDQLVIGSDRRGLSAAVSVSQLAAVGFNADSSEDGDGNVQNLDAVTVAEIDVLLAAEGGDVTAIQPPSSGVLRLSTGESTGEAVTLQVQDNAARVALGLPTNQERGQDGTSPLYWEKRGPTNWVGGADGATNLDRDDETVMAGAELLSLNLEVEDGDGNRRNYEDLGFGPAHPRYLGQVLPQTPENKADALANPYYINLTGTFGAAALRNGLLGNAQEASYSLSGGNDGVEPTSSTAVDGGVGYEDALELLEEVTDVSIVAAPAHAALGDTEYRDVQQDLISHAERMRYRIAVLDARQNLTGALVRQVRSNIDSSHAALYYPWVVVGNPLARPGNDRIPKELALPPSGFIAGVYARTDVNRGVWKPPANEVVRGALRFEREISQRQQEVLNPEGINCLRSFPGRGHRVWGARTASSDPEWKYVNVRRYFIYLEHSIDRSTQWAVFEPNGERLWSNIEDTISSFLYNEWRSGALLGTSPEQAYFVRCDRSTMTQADLDNGRLICEIGVAALKPAEFVIFRIGQKTADANA